MTARRCLLLSALALAAAWAAPAAWAQETAPLRIVVPYPPGGPLDATARVLAERVQGELGTVVVDNKPGAGGNIGMAAVAKAVPDGRTLGVAAVATLAINPWLFRKMPYDAARDFAPVTAVARVPNVLVMNAEAARQLKIASVADLIAHARENPGQLNYGSGGNGSAGHLAGELFKQQAGIEATHIPFNGANPAQLALLGGQVDFMFGTMAATYPLVTGGKLRALAVAAPQRSARLPDVPTVSETVIPGYEAYEWNGIFLPTGTPEPVAARLHQALSEVLQEAEVRQRLSDLGAQPMASTPAEFAAFLQKEDAKWGEVVRKGAIVLD